MPSLEQRGRRVGLHLPAYVSGRDESGCPFSEETRTLNVSGGGVCFESRQDLKVGTRVAILIEIPEPLRPRFQGRQVYRAHAVVCRVERLPSDPFARVGARFLGEAEA